MKNKLIISLCSAFVITVISQDIPAVRGSSLLMFLPSIGIECESEQENDEKLLILDGDSTKVEYSFKLGEIFRKIFK